ncbi:hypothetical protein KW786_03795, partial [Candidatus Parcubacteria bacterium]|nr:hypothetical protein [Candidatus Parcubacteria bacterium]
GSINGDGDVRTTMKPRYKKPIPGGQLKTILDTEEASNMLQDLQQTEKKSVFPTGPFNMAYNSGNVPFTGFNPGAAYLQAKGRPGEVDFLKKNERFINKYLSAQTGAQRGFKEIEFLSSAVPNPKRDVPKNYLSSAKASLDELATNRASMFAALDAAGYRADEIEAALDGLRQKKGVMPSGKNQNRSAIPKAKNSGSDLSLMSNEELMSLARG